MNLADRMKEALAKSGLQAADIATTIGVTPQAVNGWFSTGRITKQNLAEFARLTNVDLRYLIDGPDNSLSEPSAPLFSRPAPTNPATSDVPIIGFAIATPDKDGYFDDMGFPPGAGEGYIPWPTTDPNAYALRVRGDSMQKRIRPGEIIVVEPSAQVTPGCDVVVRTKDGRKMVKQLLYQRAGQVTFGSINTDHMQITISTEDIESIHLVSAIVSHRSIIRE